MGKILYGWGQKVGEHVLSSWILRISTSDIKETLPETLQVCGLVQRTTGNVQVHDQTTTVFTKSVIIVWRQSQLKDLNWCSRPLVMWLHCARLLARLLKLLSWSLLLYVWKSGVMELESSALSSDETIVWKDEVVLNEEIYIEFGKLKVPWVITKDALGTNPTWGGIICTMMFSQTSCVTLKYG